MDIITIVTISVDNIFQYLQVKIFNFLLCIKQL